jgi:hypothetical protein
VNALDVAEATLTDTGSGPKTETLHALSEYTLNVIKPVGALPPNKVAVSVTDAPAFITEDESAVEIDGVTKAVTVKSSHILVAPLLFESPL